MILHRLEKTDFSSEGWYCFNFNGIWEDHQGLRWGSGPIGWSDDRLCRPIDTQSLSFMYLQANNYIYVEPCYLYKITTTLLAISQKGCFADGFDYANLWRSYCQHWCAIGFARVLSGRVSVVSTSLSVVLILMYTIKEVHNPRVVGVGGSWWKLYSFFIVPHVRLWCRRLVVRR